MESTTPADVFIFLQEHIPSWFVALSTISTQTHPARAESGHSPGPRAGESQHTEIVHLENGDLKKVVVSAENSPAQTRQSSPAKVFKLKPASVGSNGASTTSNRYRAQNAIVVAYDSSAQKRLEGVVEGVTKARYLITKARASRKSRVQNLARKFMDEDEDEVDNDDDDGNDNNNDDDDEDELDDDTVLAQVRMRRAKMNGRAGEPGRGEDSKNMAEELGEADKKLENVQDVCTVAAFELLRHGDCSEETDRAVETLREVLAAAKTATATFRADEIVATLQRSDEPAKVPLVVTSSLQSEDGAGSRNGDEMPLPVRLTRALNASRQRQK